ncbi:hypothetical protein K501DRAFT_184017 [Backusella circina FSU 941]|nr:hypothetical protein K501DRAFT_184017 [Backusella circina FSU 941]
MFSEASDDDDDSNLLWPPDFYEDFNSKVWMTYRHNYPPIRPSKHKTDIGWGCMLRSGQSLLANTLVLNFLSRDWRRQKRSPEIVKQYKKIIHWFLDELSPRAPFSIHRIALLGKQLGKDIGEWFGPSTISQVIQVLVSDYPPANLSVYITTDGVIYRDNVYDMATGKKAPKDLGFPVSTSKRNNTSPQEQEAKYLYDANNIPLPPPPSSSSSSSLVRNTWKPILILVPLRLGIDSLHPTYYPTLKSLFELPWFVGIAGGKPNSSLYFIGCQGDDFIYLDPHFSRPALETKPLVYYTMNDFTTYHCTVPRKIHISNLDPSMMLGFFCRTRGDFDALCLQLEKISKKYTPIITIQQKVPEYHDDDDVYTDNDDDDDDNSNCVAIKCEENDFGIIAEDDECDIEQDDDLLFV